MSDDAAKQRRGPRDPCTIEAHARGLETLSPAVRLVAIVFAIWMSLGVAGGVGSLVYLEGQSLQPALAIVGCGALLALLWGALRRARVAQLLAGASVAVAARDVELAHALLARAERRSRWSLVRISAAAQRGALALACGWIEEAIAELDDAARVQLPLVARGYARLVQLEARAHSALARALSGAHSGARDDIARVRRALAAGEPAAVALEERKVGEMLARVALAEIVVAAQSGDDLAPLFAEHGAIVLDRSAPRERALLRGLRAQDRGAARRAQPTSPYRDAASGSARPLPPTARAWVELVMPGARVPSEPREGKAFTDRARPVTAIVRQARRPPWKRASVIALLCLLVVAVFFGAFQLLDNIAASTQPPPNRDAVGAQRSARDAWVPPPRSAAFDVGLPVLAFAAVAVVVVVVVARTRREARESNVRMVRLVEGQPRALEAIASASPSALFPKLVRWFALSREACARGAFDAALAHADAGIALLAPVRGDVDEPKATLADLRATALAGLGRAADARGEIEALPATYADRAAVRLRVELLAALYESRFEDATRIAESVTDDDAIDARTELLVDLLLVRRASPDGESELRAASRARLQREMAAPARRAFVEAVAPRLARDLKAASPSVL